jgi:dihydroorotate dehydrogenase electron transfer subunit
MAAAEIRFGSSQRAMTTPPVVDPVQPSTCKPPLVTTACMVAHAKIAEGTYRLRIDAPELATAARPGQFAMVRIPGRTDPLLARPLAVYDTFTDDIEPTVFAPPAGGPRSSRRRYADFIYAVHGRFTTALSALPHGTPITVWGPLGNGFSLPPRRHLLLVAGGIGQTALLALGRERLGGSIYGGVTSPARAERVTLCWGARHAGLFGDVADFRAAGIDTHLATLDGSAGHHGLVTDILERCRSFPPEETCIACCGPEPMMAAVAAWSASHGIECQVSLEAPMACGIGICFTCVTRVREADGTWDYRRTCVEGPIFNATQIVW